MQIKNATIMDARFNSAIAGLLKKDLLVSTSLDLLTSIEEINKRSVVIEQQKTLSAEKYVTKDNVGEFAKDSAGELIFKSKEAGVLFFKDYNDLLSQTFDITLKEKIPLSKSMDRMSVSDLALLREEFIVIVE